MNIWQIILLVVALILTAFFTAIDLTKERSMEEKEEENIDETTFKDGFTAIIGLLIVLGWKWNPEKEETRNGRMDSCKR